jgi:uncharacterized protein YchJ
MAGNGFKREVPYKGPPKTNRQQKRSLERIPKPPVIVNNQLCSCLSGKIYSECCKPYHESASSPSISTEKVSPTVPLILKEANPENILRARYCAYKHGFPEFVISTSHPSNIDYETYMVLSFQNGLKKWKKEISRMSLDYDFYGLEVISSEFDSTHVLYSDKYRIFPL